MAAITTNLDRYSWLTSEFLETIVKSSENRLNIKVNDFVVHDAVGKGENMTSYLMRATVNFTDDDGLNAKHKSYIIKTHLDSKEMNELFKTVGIFNKEIAFYRDIMPKTTKYTDLVDKNIEFVARSFATSDNPTYLVFDDLKAQGYRNMERHIGLDFNATAMVLRKLAKLHAITATIYEDNPLLFEPHKVRIVSRENQGLLAAFTCGIRDCQQMCLKWPGYEHFYNKLQYWVDNTIEISEQMYNKDDSTFNTLTHGDLWANNIMFKFDEQNNPIDVLLVDFQMGYYGPPALDLTYIFFTSTANHILEIDWDRLLQIYHVELVKSLELVKYSKRIPSLTELQIQMFKKAITSAIIALALLPPRHMDTNIGALLSDAEDTVRSRYAVYEKPEVYERLQYFLDYFDRKGLFELLPTTL